MNLIKYLEENRRLMLGGLLIICAGILLLTAWRDPLAFDAFWHLQAGKDWLLNGLDPWHDHSSFTFYGSEITSPPYLFQATLYGITELLGLNHGFQLLKLLAYLLTIGSMVFYLRRLKSPIWLYFLILPMLVLLIQLRPSVRPELLSFTLSIIAMWLYVSAGTRPRNGQLVAITLLMWLWTNYHTAIVGYVIFAAWFVDYGLRLLRERANLADWRRWFLWGLAVVGVGLLNPGFDHVIVGMFSFSPEWKQLIQEYEPPLIYANLAPMYFLLVISAFTLFMSVLQKRIGFVLIALILIYNGLNMSRMVTPAGIVLLCMFGAICKETRWSEIQVRWPSYLRNTLALILVLLTLVTLGTSIQVGRELLAHNIESEQRFPKKLTQYMIDEGKTGRVFNEYGLGGYLSYRLSPHNQVYIDGRTEILYPVEHYVTQIQAYGNPNTLKSELQKWDIDYIVGQNHPTAESYMLDNSGFGLDFVSYRYLLFSRSNATFEHSGLLHVHPACWSDEDAPLLMQERERGLSILPPEIPFVQFLGLLGAFSEAENRSEYLSGIPSNVPFSDPIHRFIGFRALELGLNEQAIAMFSAIREKHVSDYLAASQAGVLGGNREQANLLWQETQAILPSKLFPFEQQVVDRLNSWFENPQSVDTTNWGTEVYCSVN